MPVKKIRGQRIAQARIDAGFSQQGFADKLGVGRQTIARLEGGGQTPSVDMALAIAGELGQSVEALFGGGR